MKGKFAEMDKKRQEEERKRMGEERKKRETQDNMEKAKIKKELAQKAAEVSLPGLCSWDIVIVLTWEVGQHVEVVKGRLSDKNALVSVMTQVILSCHSDELF